MLRKSTGAKVNNVGVWSVNRTHTYTDRSTEFWTHSSLLRNPPSSNKTKIKSILSSLTNGNYIFMTKQ